MGEERPVEYWRRLYLMRSRLPVHRRQVEKAREVIREFLSLHPRACVNLSGGKDSTALAHLAWSVDLNVQMVSEKDDMDFPGEREFVEGLKSQYGFNLEIISPPVKLWDIILEHDFMEDIHSKGTDFSDKYFYGLLREYQNQNNINAVFLGLRAQESKGRAHNRAKNGHIYFNKGWDQWVCQPLADWMAADVFAYLFSNDVPILDVYFKTLFVGSPEQIRKSWVLPSARASQGQAVWLKYYYPEIFYRLCIVNPKLRSYV